MQWDRYEEGDTIPDTDDMTAIALILTVFGKNHHEIGEKLHEINRTIHYYDEGGQELLVCPDGLYEKWAALEKKAER